MKRKFHYESKILKGFREGNQPTLKHYIDSEDTEAKCMWCGETADEGGFDVLYEILG